MTTTEVNLSTMSDRIAEMLHPERIILFGSRARGDARPDSGNSQEIKYLPWWAVNRPQPQ